MKKLAILVVLALIAGGAWVVLHPDKAQKMGDQAVTAATQAEANPGQAAKELLSEADKAKIIAEMDVRSARMKVLKMWIAACDSHSAPPKLDGAYDGFSYDKATDYKSEEQEQEQRYKDLQDRLSGTFKQ